MTDSDIPYTDPRMTPNAMTALSLIAAPVVAAREGGPLYLRSLLARDADSAMASMSPRLYDSPVKSPRPFEADYPSGAPAAAAGNLTTDIEGRPLRARWVVGRKVVGGPDQALPPEGLNALTEAGTGQLPQVYSARSARGVASRTEIDRRSGRPVDVGLADNLTRDTALKVLSYENGRVIDFLAGQIPTDGLMGELKTV
jgi:hypothetical protein